ncbi:MAG: DMT family transporter [Hyphomicrobiales bacterium]
MAKLDSESQADSAPHLSESTLFPSLVILVSATVWGFYWFPLRTIEQAGMTGVWSVFAANLVPCLCLLPLMIFRRHKMVGSMLPIATIGLFTGLGIVCYSVSLVHSSIMRATMLFYLTPLWSTLLAYFILRERPTWQRWCAIAIGLVGLYLMLSAEASTQNTTLFGDVIGIFSGIFWGMGAVALRRWPEVRPIESVPAQYFFATLSALVFLLALNGTNLHVPDVTTWRSALPPIFIYYVLIVVPSLFALFWAAQRVSPGRTGILMMSEVVVAAISAALIAGEIMSAQEVIGAALIITSGLFEVFGSPSQGAPENTASTPS